jgi:LPXTG-site transpeptidase (sortase) family protein
MGAVDAATAKNEIYISFNSTINEDVTTVENVASIDADYNSNGVFTDAGEVRVATVSQSWNGKAHKNKPDKLPATGFAPDVVTRLPMQPSDSLYSSSADLKIEIPSLKIIENIVGVPYINDRWDLTWLGNSAGYLNGTAFPTWLGNSVITAHVYLSNGLPGPFVNLGKLKWGDRVIIHAFGQKFIYEVRSKSIVTPDDLSVMGHKDQAWVTLITCKEFDPVTGLYRMRTAVQAVLIAVQDDTSTTVGRSR